MPARVAVVGGGIAGLAAADALRSRGMAVTLFEESSRLGGIVATEQTRDGFLIEAGPDSMLASRPVGVAWARSLGLEDRIRLVNARARGPYVLSEGGLRRFPAGMVGVMPGSITGLLQSRAMSVAGRLRAAAEPLVPRAAGDADESIESFAVRRLGREAYTRLVEPLLTGIYAGNGARLSMRATFPQLVEAERAHGSVIRGARVTAGSGERRGFVTFDAGMDVLVQGAERRLATAEGHAAVEMCLGMAVTAVDRTGYGGVVLSLAGGVTRVFDGVVLATPAAVSARLLRTVDSEIARLLRGIDHSSVATVTIGLPQAHVGRALDGTGYTTPPALRRPVLACTWSSVKFAGRARDGMALFRVFIGGVAGQATLAAPDDRLVLVALAELRAVLGVSAAPQLVRVHRHMNAMPQYTLGHLDRVATIGERLAALPEIALAGNALTGVGIPDCIASGQRAADRLAALAATHIPQDHTT